jgi:hypothetical protein
LGGHGGVGVPFGHFLASTFDHSAIGYPHKMKEFVIQEIP